MKQFFIRYGIPGIYGPRVFIPYHTATFDLLTTASVWKGYDKREVIDGVEYFGFEMPDMDSVTIAAYLLLDKGYTRAEY